VPRPATGKTALRIFMGFAGHNFLGKAENGRLGSRF
jgi:hypothetical protein